MIDWAELDGLGEPFQMNQIVISEVDATPCLISATRISAKGIPFRLAASSRRNASCPASNGLQWPPILAGAMLATAGARHTG